MFDVRIKTTSFGKQMQGLTWYKGSYRMFDK